IDAISKMTKVKVKEWSFSERQYGKGPSDRYAGYGKRHVRTYVNEGNDVMTPADLFNALNSAPQLKGVSFYLFDTKDNSNPPPKKTKIHRVTDYSHFEYGDDSVTAWKYRGGYLANCNAATNDFHYIKIGRRAEFWHYEPKNCENNVVRDTWEEEEEQEDEDEDCTVEPKGVFTGECGASFLRHGWLLNHLDYGKHLVQPWKTTSIE
ncbi:hypothetical protein PENTCL1PPCAC_10892, partial [Pristionchus entomophagus]